MTWQPPARVRYSDLNSRQQENYNFQKVSAILADYGFTTMRLTDDWQGADFIAQHVDGETFLRVQLKGRLTFDKKYRGKGIFIAFCDGRTGDWYLFPHDELLEAFLESSNIANTQSWQVAGGYSFPYLNVERLRLLERYRIFPFPETSSGEAQAQA